MSTDLRAPNNPNPNSGDPSEQVDEKKKVFDLSLTQVAGGALAAMTAAALGSTLGVAGTIAGAAFASIVAGVAGSLYTASLRTGREKVRTVFRGQSTDAASAPPAPVEPATTFSTVAGSPTGGAGSTRNSRALDETQVIPAWDPLPLEKPTRQKRSRGPFPWKRAVAVSLSVFALAAVLITGYERVSGQPLSGGTGTTVSQVGNDASSGSDDKDTATTPSATPSSSSSPSASDSTPSASTSPATGTEPSASESAESPTPSASASTPESAAPSAGTGGAGEAAPTQ